MLRQFSTKHLLFLVVCICVHFLSCVSSAAIGIDFGSQLVKVALVQPGKSFHILVDEQTKRKWTNLVAFDESERQFGNNAASLRTRSPHKAFEYINWLLGESIDSPVIQRYRDAYFPYEFVQDDERGTVRIVYGADENGGEISYSAEELVAMSLQYAKKIAANEGGGDIKDCVVTVPSFFSQKNRQAILDAAQVAGLNILSLINENTAVALQYGLERNYDVDTVEHFIIYNMGASKTEVSLARYSGYESGKKKKDKKTVGQIDILSTAYDRSLGGLAFDLILVEMLADEATGKLRAKGEIGPDDDIRQFPRAMARLRKSAARAKVILSANKDTSVNIEGLHRDYDFRSKVSREDLHEGGADLFGRVLPPVKAVIKDAKLKKSDIDGIVLVGGSTRIPKVQHILQDFIGGELNQDLNADEAAALGATFRAANLSTTFRVRRIGMIDVHPYPVGIRLGDLPLPPGSKEFEERKLDFTYKPFTKRATLFNHNNQMDKRKSVAFSHDTDFHITMHHDKPSLLPKGTTAKIGTFNITGLTELAEEHAEEGKPKVQLSFELTPNGVVELVKAQGSYTEEIEVRVEKKKDKKKKKKDKEKETEPEKSDDDKPPGDDSETKEGGESDSEGNDDAATAEGSTSDGEPASDLQGEPADDTKDDEDKEAEEPEEPEEPEYRMENRTTSYPLKMSRGGADMKPLTHADIQDSQEVLRALDEKDEATRRTSAALNGLESYIYQARDALDREGIEEVSTEEERQKFSAALMDSEDWLYEDSQGRTEATYTDKLAELQDLGNDIFYRFQEYTSLPKILEDSEKSFQSARDVIGQVEEKMPWVEEEKRVEFLEKVDKAEMWLAEEAEKQEQIPKTENPILTSKMIQAKLQKLQDDAMDILRIPEPPPPKKSKKKKEESDEEQSEGAAEGEGEPQKGDTSEGEANVDAFGDFDDEFGDDFGDDFGDEDDDEDDYTDDDDKDSDDGSENSGGDNDNGENGDEDSDDHIHKEKSEM